ncbi:MAG: hypothetical protein FWG85_06615 [Bacteroidetes bacterium]|nr:hypothetical protein [Bacteroidota bacterium]
MKKIINILAILFATSFIVNATTSIVTSNADNGEGSLRKIIADAKDDDVITFAPSIFSITLTSGQIEINKNLTIDAGKDNMKKITISGNKESRIFNVSKVTFNINNLNLVDGNRPDSVNISIDSTIDMSNGSAVCCYGSTFTATNCNFNNNNAWFSGGAIYLDSTTFGATNCNFNDNNSFYGGAVCLRLSTFSATNCNFERNTGVIGGAIYLDSTTFTITNCNFERNATKWGNDSDTNGQGGAIYGLGLNKEGSIDSTNITFTVTNCTFNNNSTDGHGGAVYLLKMTSTFANCTFNNNRTTKHPGGAIRGNSNSFITVSHSTFSDNYSGNGGGAIFFDSCTFKVENCTFNNNSSGLDGGAIGSLGEITGKIKDFYNNRFTAANCTFNNNSTKGKGGAISIISLSTIIDSCSFINNLADGYDAAGGACYIYSKTFNATNCNFEENKSDYGGAIYSRRSIINNSVFNNNSASRHGSAIYIEDKSFSTDIADTEKTNIYKLKIDDIVDIQEMIDSNKIYIDSFIRFEHAVYRTNSPDRAPKTIQGCNCDNKTIEEQLVCIAKEHRDLTTGNCFDDEGKVMGMFDTLQNEMKNKGYYIGFEALDCKVSTRREWCAIFIGYSLLKAYKCAGKDNSNLLKALDHYYGRVNDMVDKLVENGLATISNEPRVGAIFFRKKYKNEGTTGGHTGIVVEVDTLNKQFKAEFITIEGHARRQEDKKMGVATKTYSFDSIASEKDIIKGKGIRNGYVSIEEMRFLHLKE